MVHRILGMDVGGTGIKLGAVEIEDRPRVAADETIEQEEDRSPEETADRAAEVLASLVGKAGWKKAERLGIGCAGLVRRDSGEVASSPNLPAWSGFGLKEAMSARTGYEVRVDNDVNSFAVAEWLWGAARGRRNAVFLTIGTGVGGAFLADGRLLRGSSGFAGEPGHATLVLDGTSCPCGNRGCAERYLGNRDLVRAARRHPGFAADPLLAGRERLEARDLSEAADAGSAVAREVLEHAGHALGGLLVTLVNVADPELVVVGGGVAQAGERILGPAREHLRERSLVARYSSPEVVPAALGPEAGFLGSAGLWLEESVATAI